MANWVKRKSKSSPGGNIRNTTTYNQGKGLTTSRSTGDRNYRNTISNLPNGKIKVTNTVRCGDYVKRETRIANPTPRFKKPRVKKLSKREAKALGRGIVFLVTLPFKILGWLFK